MRDWLGRIGVKTLYIEPGSPWENGYCESLNSKLRDELLNGEIFTTLREAQVLIENWRRHYNAVRPHSSLGYRPPAPEAILPPAPGLPYAPLRPAQTLADRRPGSNLEPGIVMWGRPLFSSTKMKFADALFDQLRVVAAFHGPRLPGCWVGEHDRRACRNAQFSRQVVQYALAVYVK